MRLSINYSDYKYSDLWIYLIIHTPGKLLDIYFVLVDNNEVNRLDANI